MTSIKSSGALSTSAWQRRLLGAGVAIGVFTIAVGAMVLGVSGIDNTEARRVQDAAREIRTNQWLIARNLDKNNSADMMRALILACDEIKARGESC
jgi:hypothetical protein